MESENYLPRLANHAQIGLGITSLLSARQPQYIQIVVRIEFEDEALFLLLEFLDFVPVLQTEDRPQGSAVTNGRRAGIVDFNHLLFYRHS